MLRDCESFAAVRGVVKEVVSGFAEYMGTVSEGLWLCVKFVTGMMLKGSARDSFNTLRKEILEVECKCSYCLLCMTLTNEGLRDKFA